MDRNVRTKSKDNNLTKAIIFILLITMIAMILVSGTYAKYTSSAKGTATAAVAKWAFNVNDTDIATNETVTFSLFDTVKDEDGSEETDVAAGVVAPGTSGEFTLKLQNASEVKAQYGIDYTITNANNVPIQYSVNGGEWSSDLADVVAGDATTLEAGASADDITIQWKWVYAGDDAADTELGDLARQGTAPTVTVEANISASQYVNP